MTYLFIYFMFVYLLQKHFASLQLLDNASDDINVHIHQIFDKFVNIISERLQAHLGDPAAYQNALIQQRQQQKDQPLESSAQMAHFLKELCSLHRVLDQYLSPEQMQVCCFRQRFLFKSILFHSIFHVIVSLFVLTGGI